jgi:hypothetical protein
MAAPGGTARLRQRFSNISAKKFTFTLDLINLISQDKRNGA